MVKGAQDETFTIYESWNVALPAFPPRSHLHSLEPIGAGTPLIECLTSYTSRLAASHCLSPAVLLGSVLAPLIGKKYWLQGGAREGTTGSALGNSFNIHARAINGIGVIASDWVRTLESLTLRTNLIRLTMLYWQNVLPPRNLLRPARTWCPACYDHWINHDQPIYEPLLWTFRDVEVCLLHQRRLRSRCHTCKRTLPWLSRLARPGYCEKCNSWLGTPSVDEIDLISHEELQWQSWVVSNLQDIIISRNHSPSPARDRAAEALTVCIDRTADGVMNRFACLIGKPKNTVWGWLQDKSLIPLNDLLRLCYSVDLALIDFLYTDGFVLARPEPTLPRMLPRHEPRSSRQRPKRLDKSILEQALTTALKDRPPKPMTQIAIELKMHKRSLYKHFPKLCKEISARYANCRMLTEQKRRDLKAETINDLRNHLKARGIYPSRRRVISLVKSFRIDPQETKNLLRGKMAIAA
jgi:hypothetical protein